MRRAGFFQSSAWRDREVLRLAERLRQVPEIALVRDPVGTERRHRNRDRIAPERLLSGRVEEVLMEVGHREFAHGAIHRIAIPEYRMVGLTDRAPSPVLFVEGDHMVVVTPRALKVEQVGLPAREHEADAGYERALHAVRSPGRHHPTRGHAGLASLLEINREPVQIVLDASGSIEPAEQLMLCGREPIGRNHIFLSIRGRT